MILFLDADGTLLHHEGYIPESALQACKEAQKNGHYICLCTGRQRTEIYGDMLKLDYDGMITGSGAQVEVKGNVLENRFFTRDQIVELDTYFTKHHMGALFETPHSLVGDAMTVQIIEEMVQKHCSHLPKDLFEKHGLVQVRHNLHEVADKTQYPVNKISFLAGDVPYEAIEAHFQDRYDIVPATFGPFGNGSGEISDKSMTKGSGMKTLLNYFGLTKADAIAIGDGFNDLPMFEEAGISVAMENADEEVKKRADYVTDRLEEHGITRIFKRLSLI